MTVAVINYGLRGYARDCLERLGAADPAPDTEFLLVEGPETAGQELPFPSVRRLLLDHGDRATAKNLALAEARGEFIHLTTADTFARQGVTDALRIFLESFPEPTVVSAQLLLENGMRRRTSYRFPSVLRECNLLRSLWLTLKSFRHVGRVPLKGPALPADGLHATSLMARKAVFESVGPFSEGYRCAVEDVEWCRRAQQQGIGRFILPEAHVFKIAPQLRGQLPVALHVAMARAQQRLVAETDGRLRAGLYGGVMWIKSLVTWAVAGCMNTLLCGSAPSFRHATASCAARLGFTRTSDELPLDIESHTRWEEVI